MEELVYIKLYCKDCDCVDCKDACLIPRDKEGCTRQVPQYIADEYYFRTKEQYPSIVINERMPYSKIVAAANDLIEWEEQNIYSAPLGRTINRK